MFVSFLLLSHAALGGWEKWQHLVVADRARDNGSRTVPAKSVRVTYLGTNGYLLEARGTRILVDPYFSRIGLGAAALNLRVEPSRERLRAALARLPAKIDAILVTHGHFDHLLDAPAIARHTRARLMASETSVHLAMASGLPAPQCVPMAPGEQIAAGRARVTALMASHDRLLGCCVPFPGTLDETPRRAPSRPSHWKCGEPLAYLIETAGLAIYVDSGGTRAVMPPSRRVDLAILGTALGDSRRRLVPALQRLRPRYFLPSHQDDFFRPMDDGFVFGTFTDFPAVRRTASQFSSRLILLDYFRPWTLR